MTRTIKILSFVILLAIGFGAYAIIREQENATGLKGNDPATANNVVAALRPLARGNMAAMRILDRPIDLSGLSFGDGDGQSFTIADWEGRVVLLNIWATWCPPCREEMLLLDNLQAQLVSKGFEVIAISIDAGSPDKPGEFFRRIGIERLKLYWEGSGKIFRALKKDNLVLGLPATILIDGKGMALGVLNGPATWDGESALKLIEKTLTLNKAG